MPPKPSGNDSSVLDREIISKNFTVREVAEQLGISAQSVYQLCATKKLAHLRLGVGRGTLRIPAQALNNFIKTVTVQSECPTAPAVPMLKHEKVKV